MIQQLTASKPPQSFRWQFCFNLRHFRFSCCHFKTTTVLRINLKAKAKQPPWTLTKLSFRAIRVGVVLLSARWWSCYKRGLTYYLMIISTCLRYICGLILDIVLSYLLLNNWWLSGHRRSEQLRPSHTIHRQSYIVYRNKFKKAKVLRCNIKIGIAILQGEILT